MCNVIIPDMRFIKRILGERKENSHKGTFGYVGLVGGSPEYSGAAKLASLSCATMRAGAGVCRLMVPKSIMNSVMPFVLESTLLGLPDREGYIAYDSDKLCDSFKGLKAIAFGMGIGQKGDNFEYLKYLLSLPIKLILDADALNTLSSHLYLLDNKQADVILTPHIGEFSRLSGLEVSKILSSPIEHATAFAKCHKVTLILKDHQSIITNGDTVYLNKTGTVGMATAGSGDVLSGILTAIAGYVESSIDVAVAGAFINGIAGEIALKENDNNVISMIASDTIGAIKKAITTILNS